MSTKTTTKTKKAPKGNVQVSADALDALMKLLQPVIEAQTRADELSVDDMHLYFHIRVYRGSEDSGDMIADLKANNSIAGVFDAAHIKTAPNMTEQTLQMHIVSPIVSKVQGYVNERVLALVDEQEDYAEDEFAIDTDIDAAFDADELPSIGGAT
jgi:hypothetical protein